MPVVVGLGSHLLADFLTKGGVPLFWPYNARFRMPLFAFKTGGVVEHVVSLLVLSLMGWFVLSQTLDNI